jgi:uncharacterized SAM-binding protein YcdF (DUF218 family)
MKWLLAGLPLAALGLWLAISMTALGRTAAKPLVHVDELAQADYIVVLGGHLERVVEAANLYRLGYAPKVVLSSGDDSANEMAKLAQAYGIRPQDLLLDGSAGRTADHPRTVRAVGVQPDSRLIVVTSALHTSRARACFVRQGYTSLTMTCPRWHMEQVYGPNETLLGYQPDWFSAVYEWCAWAMYKLRGWV